MAQIGIVGGTGYTGSELLRLLVTHPQAEVVAITSRSEAGRAVADMFPHLRGHIDLTFSTPDEEALGSCDLVFFATPNGTAMKLAPALLEQGVKVIDLAADFRLKDPTVWEQWYGMPHACPERLQQAVYGLPEINREQIAGAQLVANPGCYPTAVTLGFMPLLAHGVIETEHLIADAKSGVSGAGRSASVAMLMGEVGESFKAYGIPGHRHLPEIRQGLSGIAGSAVELTFVPHLVPMVRGIEATLYARSVRSDMDLQQLFEDQYRAEPFVDVLPAGAHPETRSVRGGNYCRLAVHRPQGGNVVVVTSVIDNLVKGAAGQAIQNMNLMLGFEETAGLGTVALLP
ncbi:MAG TPA: N-acetyl-gamma-glutamyl-phosphate reductase [Chromatiales bacterium]|nr:N-acetyl-gamma-glutamyl-phosphate reductase [Chromatiales bacterium]